MLYEAIAQTSRQLVETSSRKAKIERLAALLFGLAADEHAIAARHLSGEVAYKLGIGANGSLGGHRVFGGARRRHPSKAPPGKALPGL